MFWLSKYFWIDWELMNTFMTTKCTFSVKLRVQSTNLRNDFISWRCHQRDCCQVNLSWNHFCTWFPYFSWPHLAFFGLYGTTSYPQCRKNPVFQKRTLVKAPDLPRNQMKSSLLKSTFLIRWFLTKNFVKPFHEFFSGIVWAQ